MGSGQRRSAPTRTAAREWAPFGVTANAICPAAKSAAFMRALGDHPDIAAFADSMNPMGRVGDSYLDIAPVAVSLASEGCRYLTGNTLFVDGGGHNTPTWRAMEAPAFDWLSTWLGQPYTVPLAARTGP